MSKKKKSNLLFADYTPTQFSNSLGEDKDPEWGATIIKRRTPNGIFSASARVEPNDQDIENRWDGYKVCEYKIELQNRKARYKKMRAKYQAAKEILADIDTAMALSFGENYEKLDCDMWDKYLDSVEQGYKMQAESAKELYIDMVNKQVEFLTQLESSRRDAREKANAEQPE